MLKRYYQCDPLTFTYGTFLEHLRQLPRVRMWERGEDPDGGPKNLSTEEFVQELLAGNVKVEDLEEPTKVVDEDHRARVERELTKFIGSVSGGSQVYDRL